MATAGDILTRLNEKLNDLGSVRWPDGEHFRAITDAQNAILEARPDLFEVQASHQAVTGVIQSVPADCFRLFDVVFNLDGTDSPVSYITSIERSRLDRQRPDWMMLRAASASVHWMQDDKERSNFFVVPPQPAVAPGKYLIRYARRPTAVTSSGNNLSVSEEVVNAIYNFCMHRALEKDEKFAGSPQAASYMSKFANFLMARLASDEKSDAERSQREKV